MLKIKLRVMVSQGAECFSGGDPRLRHHIPSLLVLQWAAICTADSSHHVDLSYFADCFSEISDRLSELLSFFSLYMCVCAHMHMFVC